MISDPSQLSSFSFELSASDGLAPTLTDEGSIEFRDESDQLIALLLSHVAVDYLRAPAYLADALWSKRVVVRR